MFLSSLRSSFFRSASRSYGFIPFVKGGEYDNHFLDVYSHLLQERIIFLQGPINESVAANVTAQLLFLEAQNPERPINLYIFSPGGIVSAGLAIYDTIQYVKPEVHTICVGMCASIASLILAAGSPGNRYALPNAKIMVHQPSGGIQGVASDIEIHTKEIIDTREQLNRLLASHTNRPIRDIKKATERDTFYNPIQAKDLGII